MHDAETENARLAALKRYIGEGGMAWLIGKASGSGLDGSLSAIETALRAIARKPDDFHETPHKQLLERIGRHIEHQTQQVSTPEGNHGGWAR